MAVVDLCWVEKRRTDTLKALRNEGDCLQRNAKDGHFSDVHAAPNYCIR